MTDLPTTIWEAQEAARCGRSMGTRKIVSMQACGGMAMADIETTDPLAQAARAYLAACVGLHPDPDAALSNLVRAAASLAHLIGFEIPKPVENVRERPE